MSKQITLKRNGSRIEFWSPSKAVVAYLADGATEITYDVLADTEEVLGVVNFRQIIEGHGLDVATVRKIDTAPGR